MDLSSPPSSSRSHSFFSGPSIPHRRHAKAVVQPPLLLQHSDNRVLDVVFFLTRPPAAGDEDFKKCCRGSPMAFALCSKLMAGCTEPVVFFLQGFSYS